MKILVFSFLIVISTYARVIEGNLSWDTEVNEQEAYCNIKYDTQTNNIQYSCANVLLSSISIYDELGFCVTTLDLYNNSPNKGYGTTPIPNGVPSYIGAGAEKIKHVCKTGFSLYRGACLDNSVIRENELRLEQEERERLLRIAKMEREARERRYSEENHQVPPSSEEEGLPPEEHPVIKFIGGAMVILLLVFLISDSALSGK